MPQIIVRNAQWILQKNDDGTFTLTSSDNTVTVTVTKDQITNLASVVEAAANA